MLVSGIRSVMDCSSWPRNLFTGEQDVDHTHEGHGPGEGVDLPVCHQCPGVTLGDPVNGKEQDEETLRAQEVRTQALTQSPAAIQMKDEVKTMMSPEKDHFM